MSTAGKVITCKAAICWGYDKPFTMETIEVDPPKAHEVRYKVLSTGVCHSDVSIWRGRFKCPLGPIVIGHEGVGQVESVGEGVTNCKEGDYIIPLFASQCEDCFLCDRTNLCAKAEASFGNSTLDDGTTRFRLKDGKNTTVYHIANCSTFSQYSVSPDRAVVKINPKANMDKICLFGCCIPTGYGAAKKVAQVQPGTTCAVWGLGAVGLATMMGCRNAGASRIIGVDVNPSKQAIGKKFGMTDFVNPSDHSKPIHEVLQDMTDGQGLDYTFECVGNCEVAAQALEACKKGFGKSVMVGVADPSKTIPGSALLSLIAGRTWLGTFYGGYTPRLELPALVDECVAGKIMLDEFVTHTMPLDKINEAFDLLIAGKSIRTILLPWGKN